MVQYPADLRNSLREVRYIPYACISMHTLGTLVIEAKGDWECFPYEQDYRLRIVRARVLYCLIVGNTHKRPSSPNFRRMVNEL